ncbi:putative XRE-type DNA-binding protein [Paenibacillus endophyticus]|uniref:Putative XRE-type DNA-binding protein n=1 Tax=Paenibacillus endophyticus TaxID=1294268 RepID=A0A7W5C7W9_9BACL|nr:helix-turn-helix domain-containing protein [Paenibacillus endophyticus]MBB3151714.1 putative XRE-type DNA-binding protein [Paenibacillus endophyticus]
MQINLEPSPDFLTAIREAVREEVTSMMASTNSLDTQLMTTEDVAAFMQVSLSTVRLFARQGMPHFQEGYVIRFLKSDIICWMKNNAVYLEKSGMLQAK